MATRSLTQETRLRKGINYKFPFKKSVRGAFELNETTIDAVKDDLKILLLTNHGERLIHHDFGDNLKPLLFEPMTDIKERIADSISSAVEKWMPFVNIKSMDIKDTRDDSSIRDNEVRVKLFFSVAATGLEEQLEVSIRA